MFNIEVHSAYCKNISERIEDVGGGGGAPIERPVFCPYWLSLCFPDWLLITETECIYCAVRTGSLNVIRVKLRLRSAHTVYLCVLCGSENKQRLFPYTTLTDWFL